MNLLVKYLGVPLYVVDRVVFRWNFNSYGSKVFAMFQTGQASAMVFGLLLLPLLLYAGREFFLYAAIALLLFIHVFSNWLSRKVAASKEKHLVDRYISENPGKAKLLVIFGFCILLIFAITCVVIQGQWK
jgi:hypothetical protein